MFVIQCGEQHRRCTGSFRRPDQEEAVGSECIVAGREHRLLQRRLEVDQEVATADEIDPRVRRIPSQVVVCEYAHFSNGLADLILVADLGEEASQAFG
jgi:hypothetical protein